MEKEMEKEMEKNRIKERLESQEIPSLLSSLIVIEINQFEQDEYGVFSIEEMQRIIKTRLKDRIRNSWGNDDFDGLYRNMECHYINIDKLISRRFIPREGVDDGLDMVQNKDRVLIRIFNALFEEMKGELKSNSDKSMGDELVTFLGYRYRSYCRKLERDEDFRKRIELLEKPTEEELAERRLERRLALEPMFTFDTIKKKKKKKKKRG